jgi:hypothetical protein
MRVREGMAEARRWVVEDRKRPDWRKISCCARAAVWPLSEGTGATATGYQAALPSNRHNLGTKISRTNNASNQGPDDAAKRLSQRQQ